jgi:carotenoid 1,2-hydratase
VAPGGYAWWYLDALSDDGRFGLTVIAFVGSVFSPYYAWARRHGAAAAAAEDHCAFNVALYGPHGHRWSMTERGRASLQRTADLLQVGPSRLEQRDDDRLTLAFDEVAAPWPRRLRGTVEVRFERRFDAHYALDAAGRHRWRPIAPVARVEVDCAAPALRWRGTAYVDRNAGTRPLEDDFTGWHWSRARLPDARSAVIYDVARRDGSALSLALGFDARHGVRALDPLPLAPLPAPLWRVPRVTRSDAGSAARMRETLEDGPFYARSLVDARWHGEAVTAVHESLSLERFRRPWVRALLPFRMPRALR